MFTQRARPLLRASVLPTSSSSSTSASTRFRPRATPRVGVPTGFGTRSIVSGLHDLPPFKPPPIRQRLRPLIPFFIYWTIITSLAVHLLRARIHSKEELDKKQAQITVLSDLIQQYQNGEKVDLREMQRSLEMVGLRERTDLTKDLDGEMRDTADVGWVEVLFGKKRVKVDENDDKEEKTLDEWVQVVNGETDTHRPSSTSRPPTTAPSVPSLSSNRTGETKRAPSSNVYM
ncbi:hypothetical protein I317_03281 [Kwoniella heveanensis CBS 569]|nr:hypothetical protein I317_03281 [Kwoniella heveanensis CBS 569]